MRVLQVIDSLELGGAERMAVNYANALVGKIDASFLCATREEGDLKDEISDEVGYLFLKRKSTLDLKALRQLLKFINKNKITIIHAHSSSWFISACAKMLSPGVKLVWHDHNGARANTAVDASFILKHFSKKFDQIITVNASQIDWYKNELAQNTTLFLPNFIDESKYKATYDRENYIVCLANLREPKNHHMLIDAFARVVKEAGDWNLVLVGEDKTDSYSLSLKQKIEEHGIKERIEFVGKSNKANLFLLRAKIGVLSSSSEGFPLSVVEYGMAGLPVVATDVGEIKDIIVDKSFLVRSTDAEAMAEKILCLINNPKQASEIGQEFKGKVKQKYSQQAVITRAINLYESI